MGFQSLLEDYKNTIHSDRVSNPGTLDIFSPAFKKLVANAPSTTSESDWSMESFQETSPGLFDKIKSFFGLDSSEQNESDNDDEIFYSAKSSFSGDSTSEVKHGCIYEKYHLDDSWNFEDTFVKVPSFSFNQEGGEIGEFGTYKDFLECQTQQDLSNQIKVVIETNSNRTLHIPDSLSLRTACDIIKLAKSEPYGLKGCDVIIKLEDVDFDFVIGKMKPEEGIISTFEVTLVLHLKRPCHVRCFSLGLRTSVLHIAEQFELRKEKLYTTSQRRRSSAFTGTKEQLY